MFNQTISFCGHIAAMNNMAVAHLLEDRPDECLELLRCALYNVRTSLHAVDASTFNKLAATKHSRIRNRDCGSIFHSVPMSVEGPSKTVPSHEGGTFAFFDRVLTFSEDAFAINTGSSEEGNVEELLAHQNHMLVTLFFNMAICHHAHGMRQCLSSDLSAALKLYELAFSVIETTAYSSDFGWDVQQMILLAIYNNMGHIHAAFCNAQETQLCIDFVKRIFLARPDNQKYQQSEEENQCLLEPYDFQFFAQYVPVNAGEQCNIASAA